MDTRFGDAIRKALLEQKQRKTAAATKSPVTSRAVAVRSGREPVVPHPLLKSAGTGAFALLKPAHDGIGRQLTTEPSDAADLILGIDFGTSSSKAVILDHTAGRSYAVPFRVDGGDAYLIPTRVMSGTDGYRLAGSGNARERLKTRLLECRAKLPITEFEDACAFLALVIRHCRGWFLDQFRQVYEKKALTWSVNLGVPARSYEDEHVVRLFRRLAFASANLASDHQAPTISDSAIKRYRELSFRAYGGGPDREVGAFEFQPRDVDVIPEIAAQVFGFVSSDAWDSARKPYLALMDVGAGTVDTAFFAVLPRPANDLRFVFYSADVRHVGTATLHRARMDWICEALTAGALMTSELSNWASRFVDAGSSLPRLPPRAEDYLAGITFRANPGSRPIDVAFALEEVLPQVSGCVQQARSEQTLQREALAAVPFFACGGGARLPVYRQAGSALNARWVGSVSFAQTELPVPRDLNVPGLSRLDYDRLSVAYGLSRHGAGGRRLGDIIRRAEIPPIPRQQERDFSDRFVSKDQV